MVRIYKIINDLNDKIYVGQTCKTVEERFLRHVNESRVARRSRKRMPIVWAISKYGVSHFQIVELETLECSQRVADEREIHWCEKLNAFSPNGYNLRAGSVHGKLSEETKLKISKSNRGRVVSEETKIRLSISHLGIKLSRKTREKLSILNKGKKPSQNAIAASIAKFQKTYALVDPSGNLVQITNMAKFCRENGYSNVGMCHLTTGRLKRYKGWSVAQPSSSLHQDVPKDIEAVSATNPEKPITPPIGLLEKAGTGCG